MRLNFGGNTLETVAPFKYQSRFDARNDTARICVDLTYESLREPFPVNSGYFRYPGGGYTYYYTQGRLKTYGTIIVERENRRDSFECKAEGLSWVDRQWGRFTPFGTWRWEWMAIQAVLHGEGGPEWGRGLLDVNCWNLRKVSDNSVIWEMATAKLPDGRVLVGRVEMRALDYWESPNGHTYSHGWKVALIFNDATGSPMQLLLQVRPKIDDQTQESAPRLSGMLDQPREFWEGACDVYYKRVCIGVAAVELTHHYR
jgi:predicted secreted hydrolase